MKNHFSKYHINEDGKLCLELLKDESGVTDTGYNLLFKNVEDIIKATEIFKKWDNHYQSSLKDLLTGNKAEGVSHRERLNGKTPEAGDAKV
jgi:hypothetical protein